MVKVYAGDPLTLDELAPYAPEPAAICFPSIVCLFIACKVSIALNKITLNWLACQGIIGDFLFIEADPLAARSQCFQRSYLCGYLRHALTSLSIEAKATTLTSGVRPAML
jgi:hypothetical protein